MLRNILAIVFLLGIGAVPVLPAAADGKDAPVPGGESQDAERLREAGEAACRQMAEGAVVLGEQLRVLSHDLSREMARASREMAQASERLARDMAPALRRFGEALQDMARELEQPPRR